MGLRCKIGIREDFPKGFFPIRFSSHSQTLKKISYALDWPVAMSSRLFLIGMADGHCWGFHSNDSHGFRQKENQDVFTGSTMSGFNRIGYARPIV